MVFGHYIQGQLSQMCRKVILFQSGQFRNLPSLFSFHQGSPSFPCAAFSNYPKCVNSADMFTLSDKKMSQFVPIAHTLGFNVCLLKSAHCSTSTHDFQLKNSLKRKHAIRQRRLENESVFYDLLTEKENTPWTDEDWDRTANILSENASGPWEVMCMQLLCQSQNVSLGKSLMKYLEAREEPPHLFALTFFIQLLGETSSGSETQEEETKKYYDLLWSRTDVLDAASIEVLIAGLSSTKYYRECLKLNDIYRESSTTGHSIMSNFLDAGLRNHDAEFCHIALYEFEMSIGPTQLGSELTRFVETSLKSDNQEGLNLVMNFLEKHGVTLSRTTTDEIITIFERYQPDRWSPRYSTIHYKGGNCVACRQQMNRITISDEDFESVQKAFLDQVIVSSNIFFKSSPEELADFVDFVDKTGPFDVVIDGLNVLYRGKGGPAKYKLESTVEYFMSLKKKVLILGSNVLTRYTSKIKNMKPAPDIYMTSTTKADDVFFLYAALHSGKDTLIVTHDKLRDHKFLLDIKIRHIFRQWLCSSQIFDWIFTEDGEFCVMRRHLFSLGPVRGKNGWHIPVDDITGDDPFGKFTVLCLLDKKKQHVTSDAESTYEEKEKEVLKRTIRNPRYGSRWQRKPNKEWFES